MYKSGMRLLICCYQIERGGRPVFCYQIPGTSGIVCSLWRCICGHGS